MNLFKRRNTNTTVIGNGNITINGVSYGENIEEVVIDGIKFTIKNATQVTVICESTNRIETASGDVVCKGDVGGPVKTTSGDVECGSIHGNVSSISGDVSCTGDINGNVSTVSGDVK